ncbi:MAG: hypothetical protein ACI4LX_00695 [Treponema sp.]
MLLPSCVVGGGYAQNAKYTELMTKAKEFEAKKQWVHAAGTYADAILADPTNAGEAYTLMQTLLDSIEEGNPGRDKVSKFDLESNWKKLLLDAEQYWTVNMPYNIKLSDFQQTDIDSKTRTATYTVEMEIRLESEKTNKIMSSLRKGYEKVYQPSWKSSLPEPEKWPKESSQKPAGAKAIQIPGKLELGYEEFDMHGKTYDTRSAYTLITDQKLYKPNNVALIGLPDYRVSYPYVQGKTIVNGISRFVNAWTKCFYFVKLNIVDENGKVLATSARTFSQCQKTWGDIWQTVTVKFTGIPEAVMDIIDSGKTRVVPGQVFLEYGYIKPDSDYHKYNNPSVEDPFSFANIMKPLPEISVPVDTVISKDSFSEACKKAIEACGKAILKPALEKYIKDADTNTHHIKIFTKSQIDAGKDYTSDYEKYKLNSYYSYRDLPKLLNECYPGSDFKEVNSRSKEFSELKNKLGFAENERIYVSKVEMTAAEKEAALKKVREEASEILKTAKPKAAEYAESKTAFIPTEKDAIAQVDAYINAVQALENSIAGTDIETIVNAKIALQNLKTDKIAGALENAKKLLEARKAAEGVLPIAKEKIADYESVLALIEKSDDLSKQVDALKSAVASLENAVKGYDIDAVIKATADLQNSKTDKIAAAVENAKKLSEARKASEEPLKTAKAKIADYEYALNFVEKSDDLSKQVDALKSAVTALESAVKGYSPDAVTKATADLKNSKTDKIESASRQAGEAKKAAIAKGKEIMQTTGFEVKENDKGEITVSSVTEKSNAAKVLKVDDVISIEGVSSLDSMYIYFSTKKAKDTVALTYSRLNKKGKAETKQGKLSVK